MSRRLPRASGLVLALLAALALEALSARAQHVVGKTYCVGGFEFSEEKAGFFGGRVYVRTRQECEPHPGKWHFHFFTIGPDGKCRECWDEEDNTCATVFLRHYPGYRQVDEYECVRAGALPPGREMIRVENGRQVTQPPPPPAPPPPIEVTTTVTASPGPHAVNDTVRLTTRATGRDGKDRTVLAGEVVVRGPDGSERMRVPVAPGPDGTVGASIRIPSGGNLKFEFVPKAVAIKANETLGAMRPSALDLVVSACRLRGRVLAPAGGDVVVAGLPITLRGQVLNASGAPVPPSALSGAKAVFALDAGAGKTRFEAATVDVAGVATATVTLDPPAGDAVAASVRLLGQGGANDFCPGDATSVQLTRLGVGIEIVAPAEKAICYVGRACTVEARLKVPTDGPPRVAADAFLRSPDLAVTGTALGTPLTFQADGGDPTALRKAPFVPTFAGPVDIIVRVTAQGKELKTVQQIRVRDPLVLKLPAEIDFGTVKAGAPLESTQRALSFAASQGVEEQLLELSFSPPPGCLSQVRLTDDSGRRFALDAKEPLKFEVDIKSLTAPLVLDVPRCAGEKPVAARLVVKALNPDFADQLATVTLRWQVAGRSFLACHLWWIAVIAGILFLLFAIYGWIRPERFAVDDMVKVASKQQGLARAVGRRLRDLPGGRPGWYRSARTGLREDGSATDRPRGATVILAARRGDVVLRCPGGLRRLNQQTRKFEDVAIPDDGYPASKHVIYSAGGLFFEVS